MSKTHQIIKPKLPGKTSETVLAFAEAGAAQVVGSKQSARSFFAPEGYRRLTINLPEDLHKRLRLVAVEQDTTATEIIERLLMKELMSEPAKKKTESA